MMPEVLWEIGMICLEMLISLKSDFHQLIPFNKGL